MDGNGKFHLEKDIKSDELKNNATFTEIQN